MKIKHYLSAAVVAFAFTACDDYDDTALWDKVNENTQRIEALEAWQEQVNTNIASLQQLLNTTDCITSITPVVEDGKEVGYSISFLHSEPITIYHGEKGEQGEQGVQGESGATPQIGLQKGDDGNWYWTLNGSLMTDGQGNPIRANGEKGEQGEPGKPGDDGDKGETGAPGASAPTPQIKLGSTLGDVTIMTDSGAKDDNAWYLSVDNGATWYRISGDKGEQGEQGGVGPTGPQGDSMFGEAPKLSDDGTRYIFTLADGTTFDVPAYQAVRIGEGTGTLFVASGKSTDVVLDFDGDYVAIVAQILPEDDCTSIDTRSGNGWKVKADLAAKKATVTAPSGGKALLDISLIREDGSKVTASRVLRAVTVVDASMTSITSAGDYMLSGSRTNALTLNGDGINLILDGASVNVNSGIAVSVTGGNVTMTVSGANNTVATGRGYLNNYGAGIYVAQGASLTITGGDRDDVLRATAGCDGAGIGGYGGSDMVTEYPCGNITIQNVTVYAYGDCSMFSVGAGIGSAGKGCGMITIMDATVYAYGASHANGMSPAIGGGADGLNAESVVPTIIISDSDIHAYRGGYNGMSYADYIGQSGHTNGYHGGAIQTGAGGSFTNSTIYKYTYVPYGTSSSDGQVYYGSDGVPSEK